jgi:mannose-6-phosphate isomerase-like protein (cupin superfamily)
MPTSSCQHKGPKPASPHELHHPCCQAPERQSAATRPRFLLVVSSDSAGRPHGRFPLAPKPIVDAVGALAPGHHRGDFHWHEHGVEDEFFLVLDRQLLIDLEDRETVTLDPHQGYTLLRGVVHRTRARSGRQS